MGAGLVQPGNDVGNRIADAGDFAQLAFANDVRERHRKGAEAFGCAGIGLGPIGIAAAQRHTLPEFSTQIVEKLNKEINAALADPNMKKRLTDLGCAVFAGSPADFGKFIGNEIEKWAKVIRAANIKPE
jgi:hypothetical protein